MHVYLVIAVIVVVAIIVAEIMKRIRIGNLKTKSVVISGCDSGFGQLLALRLLERGMRVFAGCYTDKVRVCIKYYM